MMQISGKHSYIAVVTCNLTSEYKINVILYIVTMKCYATHGTQDLRLKMVHWVKQSDRQIDRQTDRQTLKIVGQLSDS